MRSSSPPASRRACPTFEGVEHPMVMRYDEVLSGKRVAGTACGDHRRGRHRLRRRRVPEHPGAGRCNRPFHGRMGRGPLRHGCGRARQTGIAGRSARSDDPAAQTHSSRQDPGPHHRLGAQGRARATRRQDHHRRAVRPHRRSGTALPARREAGAACRSTMSSCAPVRNPRAASTTNSWRWVRLPRSRVIGGAERAAELDALYAIDQGMRTALAL